MQKEEKAIKTISVMLDASGTSNHIDDQSAQIFIKQLEEIRLHFKADIGTISVSTSFEEPDSIKYILDILSRNLTGNIVIGLNFLAGYTYDYKKNALDNQGIGFNTDKVATFAKYYISNPEYDNQWFALIDDNLYDDVYRQYRDIHPMFVCRPTYGEHKANFMLYDTETENFDGVIEGLDYYIKTIKNMTREEILNHQMHVLSNTELQDHFKKGNFTFLKKFLSEGHARIEDCDAILELFRIKTNKASFSNEAGLSKEELQAFSDILDIIYKYYEKHNNEKGLKKINNIKAWPEFRAEN